MLTTALAKKTLDKVTYCKENENTINKCIRRVSPKKITEKMRKFIQMTFNNRNDMSDCKKDTTNRGNISSL